MRIWLDDVREAPCGWLGIQSPLDAIRLITSFRWSEISLDHDLAFMYGEREITGYDVLMHIVQMKMDGRQTGNVRVHTANPVARERMEGVIERYLN